MKKKPQVTEYWKNAVQELRRDIVEVSPCRLVYDMKRNANGDATGMENFRAAMRAKTVNGDFVLTVDVDSEPKAGRLDGLSVATFEGLAEGGGDDLLAVFTNGRALPFLRIETPKVADPAERTARELTHTRLAASKQPDKTAVPDWLSIAEAAKYRNVTERTIREWLKKMDGQNPMLKFIRNGKEYRILRESLEPWGKKEAKTRVLKKASSKKRRK